MTERELTRQIDELIAQTVRISGWKNEAMMGAIGVTFTLIIVCLAG